MLAPDFMEQLSTQIDDANQQLNMLGAPYINPMEVMEEFNRYREYMLPYIADTSLELYDAIASGKHILAEGAQGTLLDIDHGTYPFVTSSATVASGVFTGLGIGITAANGAKVTGVCKSFQTRVGSGPFPTEVFDDLALRLRGSGANPWDEYGTTTGRARRVGWLDGVLLRYAVRINGLTELVITKLDILSGFQTLKLCVAYRQGQKVINDLPFGPSNLEGYEPVYEEMPGWVEDVGAMRSWDEIPNAAKNYLEAIARLAGVPVRLVSVGPEREQVVSAG
jgi:adenylosuccinate synthase